MRTAPRKTNSIARAVTRALHWGGSGDHWMGELRRGAHQEAAVRNVMTEETSDTQELRRIWMQRRVHQRDARAQVRRAVEQQEADDIRTAMKALDDLKRLGDAVERVARALAAGNQ